MQTLYLFPTLELFRLDLQGWDLESYPYGAVYFSYESPSADDDEPWRTLLNDSLLALCSSSGAFSTLEIYDLPPISGYPAYSALLTDEWKALLGCIGTLIIQLAEIPGNGASNITCDHQAFLTRLEEYFLDHLPNVKHLRLAGRADACIGGSHEAEREPITWKSIRISKIRIFELEWSRIDEEAALFVEEHLESLEKVHLRDCFASSKLHWRQLFENIVTLGAPKLVRFKMLPARPGDDDVSEHISFTVGESDAGDGSGSENSHADGGDFGGNGSDPEMSDMGDQNGDEADGGGSAGENSDEADGSSMGDQHDDDSPGDDAPERKIRHRRFVSVEVQESYGYLEGIDYGSDEEEEEDDKNSEANVLEALEKVSALVDRNRRAAGLT